MTIIFYDLPSTTPQIAFSPNTWKVRHALNYKGIPYKTEWLDFIHIESRCKELGIPHTSLNADGRPQYTLPAIHDPKTGVYLADSFAIAEYLEKTYPETPSLFPHDSIGLQVPFDSAVRADALKPLWSFMMPAIYQHVRPESKDYFRRTREARFGKTLEDLNPKGNAAIAQWNKLKDGFGTLNSWYKRSGGPFILGNTVSWADFVVGSWLIWIRIILGEESNQWKDIASWYDGRFNVLMADLKKYEAIL